MDALTNLGRKLAFSKWNYHDKVVCQMLVLREKEGLSVCSQLSQLISDVENAGGGRKRDRLGETISRHSVDLYLIVNHHGLKEKFKKDSLSMSFTSMHQPRYVKFAWKQCITIQNQLTLVRHVTGEQIKGLDEATRK